VNFKANDRTAGRSGDPQRRAACPTSNIEQGLLRGEVQPLQKNVLLFGGEPTVLPDILAKSFAADLRIQFRLEIPVVCVVVTTVSKECFIVTV
jgi:hypothetical protein